MFSQVSVCPQEGGCLSIVEGKNCTKNCTQKPAAYHDIEDGSYFLEFSAL